MRHFYQLFFFSFLILSSSCNKDTEGPNGSGNEESVHFSMVFDSVSTSLVKNIVGEASNTTIAYSELAVSRDAGETWTNYYGQIETVSKAGRAIYKNGPQPRYLMHPGGGISKFVDQRFDTYYIDSEDHLYHVKEVYGRYQLEVGSTGFDWEAVENHPEHVGAVILGPYPGEGMAFLNSSKRKVYVYSPSTSAWDSTEYVSDLNPRSDHYSLEGDGRVYMPDVFDGLCDIVDLKDGSVEQVTIPQGIKLSGEPNFEAAADGTIFCEGYDHNTRGGQQHIYRWNGAAWEEYELPEYYEFHGGLKVYGNTMYFYAFCNKGAISKGLAIMDLATGQIRITGKTSPRGIYSGFVTSDDKVYTVNYDDRQLYRHDGDVRYPTGIYDVFGYYEDSKGNLFMMSDADTLYMSNTDLSNMRKVEGVLANNGGDMTYGNAEEMVMRQLEDGTYVLWLVTNYVNVFINYTMDNVFVSDDGLNWTKHEFEKLPGSYDGSCMAMDPNGTIIYAERQVNHDLNLNNTVYWQSSDMGISWSAYTGDYPPDFISSSGNYIYSSGDEIRTSKDNWEKMAVTQDHFNSIGGGTLLSGGNRIIVVSDQLWISDKEF